MISAACEALLAASARYHPLYAEGLSNHLPMALIALDAMDASSEQLQRCICAAASSLDDHVVKLIYTARAEFTRTQDTRYQRIAARKAWLAS
jgi:hypothetical protein